MSFTERKKKGSSTYYYRTISYRKEGKVRKKRIYLGRDLDEDELKGAEIRADRELGILSSLLLEEEIRRLELLRKRYSEAYSRNVRNRYEAFISRFTHDSTAIEGNTLTLQETATLLFEGISPSNKSMREINEVINHRKAFDYLLSYKGDINRQFILKLNEIVTKNTLDDDINDQIGKYRNVQVYIRGVEWMPPSPEDVPQDMKELLSWYTRNRKKLHPLITASYFHVGFETVHPFVDGNGRVGRLLMNFILHKNGFPMVNIPERRKLEYYRCLEEGQTKGKLRPFIALLYDLMMGSELLF